MSYLFFDTLRANVLAVRRSQYIAAAFLVFATLVMWEGVNLLVSGREIATEVLALGIVGFIFWSALFALSFLLLDPSWFAYAVYAAASMALLALFGWQEWPIIGIIAFLLFTVSARQRVNNERELLASFRLSRLVGRGLPSFFTGTAILLAFVAYFSPYGAATSRPEISRALVDLSFVPINFVAAATIRGYEQGMNVGQLQSLMLEQFLPPSIGPLKITPETKKSFSAIKDEKILGESLAQFAHEQLNAYLARVIEPYKSYLPIFFVSSFFLTFKVMSIPLVWFTQITAWGLMKLLIALDIAKFGKEEIERERLTLK